MTHKAGRSDPLDFQQLPSPNIPVSNELRPLWRATRRGLLQAGVMSGWGLSWGSLMRAQAVHATEAPSVPLTPKIKSCIVIFYYGGPSHIDTFDPKPEAPSDVRGEFSTIATSVPGLRIGEHQPHTARVMHHVGLIRSMSHDNRLHDSAGTETFTGRKPPNGDREEFAPIPQVFPSHGAILSHFWQSRRLDVTHALLPFLFHNVVDVPCQGGGFLGSRFDPFMIGGDASNLTFRAESLSRPNDLSMERIARRRSLKLGMGAEHEAVQAGELLGFYDRAFELLGSEKIRRAMDITAEDPRLRERYGLANLVSNDGPGEGQGRQLRGQSLLLARRLVEAGVPYVNIHDFYQQGQNWDSHANNFKQHRDYLLPPADRAFAALIEDLEQRGLLDTTLVIALGEFGRTPRINGTAGRDHWPDCYSVALAGGGIQGGAIYGSSDRLGAYPETDPCSPADLAATIFWRFGLNPASEIRDRTGRPYKVSEGQPLKRLFSDGDAV